MPILPRTGWRPLVPCVVVWLATPGVVAGQVVPPARLSVSTAGTQSNGPSHLLATTPTGRFVLFTSQGSTLVGGDTNGVADLFVRDRDTDGDGRLDEPGAVATVRVSVGSLGAQADRAVETGVMSDNGRWIVFTTEAGTLVTGDTNGVGDVFVRDRDADGNGLFDEPGGVATARVSEGTGGTEANGPSMGAAITPDGRYVLFLSTAANLSAAPTGTIRQVYRKDRQTGELVLVSSTGAGVPADAPCEFPTMSASGEVVAFRSEAASLSDAGGPGLPGVFIRNLATGFLERQASGGRSQGNVILLSASVPLPGITADGSAVYFLDSYGVAGVTTAGATGNIFEFDRRTRVLRQVAIGTSATLSRDERFLVVTGPSSGALGCLVTATRLSRYDRVHEVTVPLPVLPFNSVSIARGTLRTVFFGVDPCPPQPPVGFVPPLFLSDPAYGAVVRLPAPARPGLLDDLGETVVFDAFDAAVLPGGEDTNGVTDVVAVDLASRLDGDGDGLDDRWETATGLRPDTAGGPDGAAGDPDADGVTNAQELASGTHPRGDHTQFLAEGVSNAFFDTRLALFNPDPTPATAVVRVLGDSGRLGVAHVPIPAFGRRTLDMAGVGSLPSASFSIVVESDGPVVVDRTVTWNGGYLGAGAHAETAIPAPSTTWLFAEGSTTGSFSLFYLLQNPGAVPAEATIRYLRPAGLPPVEIGYTLPPLSRTTIPVNLQSPALASTDGGAVISSTQPIVAERAMYLSRFGTDFAAGHASAGVTAASTRWFFAEGTTGPYFDTFLLIANPADTMATVEAQYLLPNGQVLRKTYDVAAASRLTIWVDGEEIPGQGQALANTDVSTILTSTNGIPIVAERSMWFPGIDASVAFWVGAHNSPGATETGPRWAVADGWAGGRDVHQTYVLVANTSGLADQIRVRLAYEDGGSDEQVFDLAPNSRTTIGIADHFPAARGRRFGTLVESLSPGSQGALVVERVMYTLDSYLVASLATGTSVLGTRLP